MINGSGRLRGLDFGAGTPYRLSVWPSGLGTPPIRTDDRERPRRHGVVPGDDLLGARELGFEFVVQGESLAELEQRLTDLSTAFAPSSSEVWLDLRVAGSPAEYQMVGRARGCEWDPSRDWSFGAARARAVFVATDPRKFGPLVSRPVSFELAAGDLVLPETLPFTMTPVSLVASFQLDNAGSLDVDWVATITGPVTDPVLEHTGLGAALRLRVSLEPGETLVLDSSTATVHSPTGFRPDVVDPTSTWWRLTAGTNPMRWSALAGVGQVQIDYRPAWA